MQCESLQFRYVQAVEKDRAARKKKPRPHGGNAAFVVFGALTEPGSFAAYWIWQTMTMLVEVV